MSPRGEDQRKERGPDHVRNPPPLPPSGAMSSWPGLYAASIRDNDLTARDRGVSSPAGAHTARAVATVARARSRAVTPDGRRGCKTVARGFASRAGNLPRIPDGRNKKTRNRRLRAGPRRVPTPRNTGCPVPPRSRVDPPRRAAARRNDRDNAGSGPGVSPDRGRSVDTAERRAAAATAAPPRDIPGYSSAPADASAGRTSRIP